MPVKLSDVRASQKAQDMFLRDVEFVLGDGPDEVLKATLRMNKLGPALASINRAEVAEDEAVAAEAFAHAWQSVVVKSDLEGEDGAPLDVTAESLLAMDEEDLEALLTAFVALLQVASTLVDPQQSSRPSKPSASSKKRASKGR